MKITKRQLKRLIDESMHDEMADHDITASPLNDLLVSML